MDGNPAGSKAAMAAAAWGAVLGVAFGQRNRFFRVLHEFGLTPGDLRALSVLAPGDARPMGSLAQAWACDPSNVTWMVDRLEARGLVERKTLAADRRVKTVALTPLGAKTRAEVFERLYQPPEELLALDQATLETLRDALAKLPASLHGLGGHGHPDLGGHGHPDLGGHDGPDHDGPEVQAHRPGAAATSPG